LICDSEEKGLTPICTDCTDLNEEDSCGEIGDSYSIHIFTWSIFANGVEFCATNKMRGFFASLRMTFLSISIAIMGIIYIGEIVVDRC
jgi:hypothetical protein